MKPLFIKWLILALCVIALPAHAQIFSVPRAGVLKHVLERQIIQSSLQNNLPLRQRLSALFNPAKKTSLQPLQALPPGDVPFTFRVHRSGSPYSTASAFAVEIDGRIFGVTAGHVMTKIASMENRAYLSQQEERGIYSDFQLPFPQMRVQLPDGSFLSQNIVSWRQSNPFGTDVAVFEIPPQMRPYVRPLPLSGQQIRPGQTAAIAGFADDRPLWFPSEEILFASSYRLLLRKSSPRDINGMCGAPVLIDNQVAGLYVGAYLKENYQPMWHILLQNLFSKQLPEMHRAAPIESIFPLINELTGKATLPVAQMKVFGRPVAELHPEEQIYSVQLIRNGEEKETLYLGDLTDPEHLENFFTLQENDILRITIDTRTYSAQKDKPFLYEVNVSTGQVTRRELF